ncbi:MAG TPA: hypothetical protein HPP87_07305 [Planctomycetes bacterium]|nr:hypothetical protein [Planctomycetota bacterium]
MIIEPDYNRLAWISAKLHIIDKRGHFRLLAPNNGQLLLHAEMQQQRARNLPVRIVLLKPRQVGWSTWTEAEAFHDVYHQPNTNAMAVSVDADSTDVIFGMAKRYHTSHPEPLPTDNTNRKAIIFSDPHRSAFHAQTAGKVGVGRSFQARFLHCSEVAFWSDAATQLAGLYQMVPEDPGTYIILESTANGMGGAFYDTYMEAKERVGSGDFRGFRPVFFPWYEFNEYSVDPPDGFEATPEERQEAQLHSLTDAQLYWRRLKIQELNGRIDVFRQEYPATDLEAFQTSGAPVFDAQTIEFQAKHIRSDIRYGLFDPHTGTFEENQGGSRYGWAVLDDPRGEEHVIGADTREHRLSDDKDLKSERDYDGVVVLSRHPSLRRIKAIFHGRMEQKDLGLQVLGAAKHYGSPWVVPEVPQGMMVLQVLRDAGYYRIFNRRGKDETFDPEDTDNLGFRTTTATRHMLVHETIPYLRTQSILIQFEVIVNEMRTFIYDKMGKPIHRPSKHDDLLFGLFLAMIGDIYCPRSPRPVILPATTGNADDPSYLDRYRDPDIELSYSGAVDPWEPGDDDDWGEETTV